jgi:hypothetical protein
MKLEMECAILASFLITINTHNTDDINAIRTHQIRAFWKNEYCRISSMEEKLMVMFIMRVMLIESNRISEYILY